MNGPCLMDTPGYLQLASGEWPKEVGHRQYAKAAARIFEKGRESSAHDTYSLDLSSQLSHLRALYGQLLVVRDETDELRLISWSEYTRL